MTQRPLPCLTARGPVAYLGPPGTWTHQACLELWGQGADLRPMPWPDLLQAHVQHQVALACVPATTSLVGATPYLADMLTAPGLQVVAQYPRMLGFSLLARPGARLHGIRQVLAHPVALQEAAPWLDRHLPHTQRLAMDSGGAAAQAVAQAPGQDGAALGPPLAGVLYGLSTLAEDIEAGPHNVTRWWVLGHGPLTPMDDEITALSAPVQGEALQNLLNQLQGEGLRIHSHYTPAAPAAPGAGHSLIEVAGHAQAWAQAGLDRRWPQVRVLGRYAAGG